MILQSFLTRFVPFYGLGVGWWYILKCKGGLLTYDIHFDFSVLVVLFYSLSADGNKEEKENDQERKKV